MFEAGVHSVARSVGGLTDAIAVGNMNRPWLYTPAIA